MMLYISKVANRSYMQWNYIKAVHRINHFDTGTNSGQNILIQGQNWKCGVMNIMTYSPHGGNMGNTERGSGVHAWWVDLFFRVFVGADKPYFNTMGTLSNSGDAGVKYFTINHGYQIGDNWEENNYTATRQTHNEESTINIWNVPDSLNASIYFPSRISGDMSTCLGMYYGSSNAVDGNDMWRPVLVPTEKLYLSVELNTNNSYLITKLLNRKAVLLNNLEKVYQAIETFQSRIKAINPTTMYIAQRYVYDNVDREEMGYESDCTFSYADCRAGGANIYSKDNTKSAVVYIYTNWVPVRSTGWWSGNDGPRWWVNLCLVEENGILYFGSYGKLYNTKDNYDTNNGNFLGRGWQNPARYKLPITGTLDWTDRNVVWGSITSGTMYNYLTELYNISDSLGNPTTIKENIAKVNAEINAYYGN